MLDRTLKAEIKKLVGDGSREAKFAALYKVLDASSDLSSNPRERFNEALRTHGRAAVSVAIAATLWMRRDRLDGWNVLWAMEVLDLLHGWTPGNKERVAIHDERFHPTAICDYAQGLIEATKEAVL